MVTCTRLVGFAMLALIIALQTDAVAAPQSSWTTLTAKADAQAHNGDFSAAIAIGQAALTLAEKTYGPGHEQAAVSLSRLAYYHSKAGHFADAESLYLRAIAIMEQIGKIKTSDLSSVIHNLADVYDRDGKTPQAESTYRRAVEVSESAPIHEPTVLSENLFRLANFYFQHRRYEESTPLYQRCFQIREGVFEPNSVAIADVLNALANLDGLSGNYLEAESKYKRVLQVYEQGLGSNDFKVAMVLISMGDVATEHDQYVVAEPVYKRALDIYEKRLPADHPAATTLYGKLANTYKREGKFADAVQLAERVVTAYEHLKDTSGSEMASALETLADLHSDQFQYATAIGLLQRALEIRETIAGKGATSVLPALRRLALAYVDMSDFKTAEPLLLRAEEISESKPHNSDVATSELHLAYLYFREGRYDKSATYCHKALIIRQDGDPVDEVGLAGSLHCEGAALNLLGRYSEAEPMLNKALELRERRLGSNDSSVGSTLAILAQVYQVTARQKEAEEMFRRALTVEQAALAPNDPQLAELYAGLGTFYKEEGNFSKSLANYMAALNSLKQTLGIDHPRFITVLNDTAELYFAQNRYADAVPLFQRALDVRERVLGSDNSDVADSMNDLGLAYFYLGKYADSLPLFQKALEIRQKLLGEQHPFVGAVLNNLALTYTHQKDYACAESLFKRAIEIRERALGPDSLELAQSIGNLASLYITESLPDLASPQLDRVLGILYHQFRYHFEYLSEKDRLRLLGSQSDYFAIEFSFVQKFHVERPELVGRMFDVLLWQKGFVLRSVASLHRQIEESGDKEALALFNSLTAKRTLIANLTARAPSPSGQEPSQPTSQNLEKEADEIEQALVKRSELFSKASESRRPDWQEVQAALRKGQAAVEFVRYPFWNGEQWTHTRYYAALVLTRETTQAPHYILLGDAKDIEGEPLAEYYKTLTIPIENRTTLFYRAVWEPLEVDLRNIKQVYVAPDGVLNQIAFGILADANNRLLIGKHDVRIVGSTREIVEPGGQRHAQQRGKAKTAVLIGDPDFDLAPTEYQVALDTALKNPRTMSLLPIVASNALEQTVVRGSQCHNASVEPVKGSAEELTKVNGLLSTRGWQTAPYRQKLALSDVLSRVHHPDLLHIATHGFFCSDEESEPSQAMDLTFISLTEEPLLRSGLLFAGANQTISGHPPPLGLGDGIFSAFEATALDLQGTQLVVLSACDTGRGAVSVGEGVFGLMRALQVAGAHSVLMTLWSVQDEETKELMIDFYSNWLNGQEMHSALRKAQLEMRKKVRRRNKGKDIPLYWGAFVLVGN